MSFYNKKLQVILQIYLSGNLSPFSEVYLYLKFTVTGQFVLTVCAFHGYALVGVLFSFLARFPVQILISFLPSESGPPVVVRALKCSVFLSRVRRFVFPK